MVISKLLNPKQKPEVSTLSLRFVTEVMKGRCGSCSWRASFTGGTFWGLAHERDSWGSRQCGWEQELSRAPADACTTLELQQWRSWKPQDETLRLQPLPKKPSSSGTRVTLDGCRWRSWRRKWRTRLRSLEKSRSPKMGFCQDWVLVLCQ